MVDKSFKQEFESAGITVSIHLKITLAVHLNMSRGTKEWRFFFVCWLLVMGKRRVYENNVGQHQTFY